MHEAIQLFQHYDTVSVKTDVIWKLDTFNVAPSTYVNIEMSISFILFR